MLHNLRTVDNEDPNRPRLRRATGSCGSGTGDDNGGAGTDDSDDRPTRKRRDN